MNQDKYVMTYIKLTIQTEGFRVVAYMTEAIDDNGDGITLSFYNLPATGTANTMTMGEITSAEDEMEKRTILGKTVFQPGTVVYIKDPWLKVGMDGTVLIRVEDCKDIAIFRPESHCYYCNKSEADLSTKLLRCGKCHGAFYCNRECQIADRKVHKRVCNDYESNKQEHDQRLQESRFL
jgi:hypothetical protein